VATGTTSHPPVYSHIYNHFEVLHFFLPPGYAIVHAREVAVLPAKNKFTFDYLDLDKSRQNVVCAKLAARWVFKNS
jgi:hypothetical protein